MRVLLVVLALTLGACGGAVPSPDETTEAAPDGVLRALIETRQDRARVAVARTTRENVALLARSFLDASTTSDGQSQVSLKIRSDGRVLLTMLQATVDDGFDVAWLDGEIQAAQTALALVAEEHPVVELLRRDLVTLRAVKDTLRRSAEEQQSDVGEGGAFYPTSGGTKYAH
jgi:hypothetical protein